MTAGSDIHITEEIFIQAYDAHWRDLYLLCYRYVQDAELAKELVQELFISIWEKRATRIIHTSLRSYLFSALKLKILEYYRKQSVREQYIQHKIQSAANEETNFTERHVVYNELRNALEAALRNMPERSREVYLLSREKGMDNKSIAATLFITEKAVEGNITRALSFIRKRLRFFNQ